MKSGVAMVEISNVLNMWMSFLAHVEDHVPDRSGCLCLLTVSMRRGPQLCGLDGAFRFVCRFPVPREQFVQA